jgi:hypothetical protein
VTTATQDGEWCNVFWLPSLSANPSVRRHLGKSWFQYMARHTWEATMVSTAPCGHYCHGGTNATRAPTPCGQRATGYCHEGLKTWFFNQATCTSGRTFLHRNTWRTTMASMASDGHTYNPVLTGIHRAAIADSTIVVISKDLPYRRIKELGEARARAPVRAPLNLNHN